MGSRGSGELQRWSHRVLFIIFFSAWCLVILRQVPATSVFPEAHWPEPMLLMAALLVTVSTLAQQISLQNAVAVACVVGGIGGGAHWMSYVSGVPFGPVQFPYALGTTPFQEWFCVPAMIWVVVVLNARGLARLILERAAKHRNHGWHLLWLGALLTVGLAMAMEPFLSTVHHYWLWGETRLSVAWQHVPLSCLLAWGVVNVIATFAATPFLIDKHPRPRPPATDPAWVWAMVSGLFALGTAVQGLWPAAAVSVVNAGIALAIAGSVRGRRAATTCPG